MIRRNGIVAGQIILHKKVYVKMVLRYRPNVSAWTEEES